MRSSSIKSIIAVLLISVTVLAATPAAAARQTQSKKSQNTRTREVAPSTDRFAGVRELINRTLRRLGLNGGISIPTPRQDEDSVPEGPNGPTEQNEPA